MNQFSSSPSYIRRPLAERVEAAWRDVACNRWYDQESSENDSSMMTELDEAIRLAVCIHQLY